MSLTPSTSTATEPERSLNRQIVLEEDEYTAALSKIIARDFFPSLVQLDATNDYLDALTSQDPTLIQASVRRLEDISDTPVGGSSRRGRHTNAQDTPFYSGDTPLRTPRGRSSSVGADAERPSKRLKYDTDMNLDEFQARYTSEDNSSFTQILDEENRQRRERYGWAWEAEKKAGERTRKMIEARENMLVEGIVVTGMREKFMLEPPEKPAGLITAGGETDDAKEDGTVAVVNASGKEVSTVEEVPEDPMAKKKDKRNPTVDAWRFKNRNALMFAPDADASPYHGTTNFNPAVPNPKFIKHDGTRLIDDEQTGRGRSQSVPPSPTRSRIDAAITGTPYRPKSPTINNFSLVPNLPSPTPAELGPTAVNQLMTWGTLSATPRIISQSGHDHVAVPASPFHLRDISARERLSNRLSSKAAKSLRDKAGMMGLGGRTPGITPRGSSSSSSLRKGSMQPPHWTPKKADAPGSLTPAARRLLDRSTLGTAAARRADVMGMRWESGQKAQKDLNKVRWTPTPGR